jgi:hypothetical protein
MTSRLGVTVAVVVCVEVAVVKSQFANEPSTNRVTAVLSVLASAVQDASFCTAPEIEQVNTVGRKLKLPSMALREAT